MANKPTREQVIKMFTANDVYDTLDLELFYDEEKERYPSIYDLMNMLGVHENEIDYVKGFSLKGLSENTTQ